MSSDALEHLISAASAASSSPAISSPAISTPTVVAASASSLVHPLDTSASVMALASASARSSSVHLLTADVINRYSVHSSESIHLVCLDGNFYVPKRLIWGSLDRRTSIPGSVYEMALIFVWIEQGQHPMYACMTGVRLANKLGISEYGDQVVHNLLAYPQLREEIPRFVRHSLATNSVNVRPLVIYHMSKRRWNHGDEESNIAAVALQALESLVPVYTTSHGNPAVQRWIDYRRGTSVIPEPSKRAKSE